MDRAETDTDPDLTLPIDEAAVVIIDLPPAPDATDSFAITFRPPPNEITIYAQQPRTRMPRATRPPTDERD